MCIRAVAFDFGNVISVQQDPLTMRALAAIGGVSEEQARDIVFTGRDDWDRGDLSGPDHYRRGFSRYGRAAEEIMLNAFMRADLESWATINEGTVKLIADVKAAGMKTAILSNMPKEFIAMARDRFPVISNVDIGVFSCEYSVVKPDKVIYEILLKELSLPGESVIFFDDMEPNIRAAFGVGIRAHLWTDSWSARKIIEKAGVSV